MAQYIKKLSGFSPDAISTAIRANPLSRETIQQLKNLSEMVAKAPKPAGRDQRTAAGDFLEFIVPKLESIAQQQRQNPQGHRVATVANLAMTDTSTSELDDLLTIHRNLCAQEASFKTRILLVRIQRGLVYLRAHQLITDIEELQQWLSTNFAISYATATSYMSVTNLVKRFPGLVKCGLTFEQIRRHNKRLHTYFESHPEDGWNEACDITDSQSTVTVEPDPDAHQVPDCGAMDPGF